ncbi:Aste57867_19739 [Aphanomyces stellatus]|uniref:Aste57867_19739 protein n=1 Tax=Aphanomyces stellatus TaxID=120398 RepID=A0A485LDX7_9STRA|nr:hypothetical protein As57867_019674 [Aphanomyces stellatus]VFT96437.1 Aste57867_19739 [Aphanomyces stellatus]
MNRPTTNALPPRSLCFLGTCSLWLQANMHITDPLDALCVVELVCDMERRRGRHDDEDGSPTCRCRRAQERTSALTHAVTQLMDQDRLLLRLAMRHAGVTLGQDAAWTWGVLDVFLPARTLVDVLDILLETTSTLASWVEPYRASLTEACGGATLLAMHRQFVSSQISPHLVAQLAPADLVLVHALDLLPDTPLTPFALFVPTFNDALDICPFLVDRSPVRLQHARVMYHAVMPLVVSSDAARDTVDGYAATHVSSPAWLHLKRAELRVSLGASHTAAAAPWPADVGRLSSSLPLLVHCSRVAASPYPHMSLVPDLPIDAGSVPNLVECERGNVPIILSVPHGGSAACRLYGTWQKEHLHMRKPSQTSRKRFTMLADALTVHVGAASVEAFEARTGGLRPYLVIAKFHRKFVDVNRAVDDDAYVPKALAARMYAHYHSTLAHVLQEIWMRFPMHDPLLLDIHGQRAKSDAVLGISNVESKEMLYMGTRNGRTLHAPCHRAFVGDLDTALRDEGWRGTYPKDSAAPERREFLGGYIVQTYGMDKSGADAIQLEMGTHLRGTEMMDVETCVAQRKRTASAMAATMEKHLIRSGFIGPPRPPSASACKL